MATDGTPSQGQIERPARRGDQRGLAENVQDAPEGQPDGRCIGEGHTVGDPQSFGPAAEVGLVLPLAGDHEFGVDPGIDDLPRGVEEGDIPRPRPVAPPPRSPARRPDRGGPPDPDGSGIPGGYFVDQPAGTRSPSSAPRPAPGWSTTSRGTTSGSIGVDRQAPRNSSIVWR